MSAMYRLKAYFGMVPAEEMGDFAEETVGERYGESRRTTRQYAEERWEDRLADEDEPETERDTEWERRPSRATSTERSRESSSRITAGAGGGSGAGAGLASTRGALAIDTDPVREPSRPLSVAAALPEQRDQQLVGASALARITTLQPSSYNEARTIGERYRDGQPVIINLTELDDAAAKRLVDFAAGLAFALRGSIDKVTSRVFLLTPADVEVSADDARKLAERSSVRSGSLERGLERSIGGVRLDPGRSLAGTRLEDRGIFRQD
jgi:cell division inhibitor SepF